MPFFLFPLFQSSDFLSSLWWHSDGGDFYSKVFTKADFANYLDKGFRDNGLLEGFVFDDTTEEGLRFATSVSYPQSDMYISLIVTVKANGTIVVSKDNLIETDSGEE